jgi:hypothetical protein
MNDEQVERFHTYTGMAENHISVDGGAGETSVEGVTRLYHHVCVYQSCPSRWSKFGDHSADQADLEANVANEPIVHRHTFNSSNLTWDTDSFTINSPLMKAHLENSLADYQDLDLGLINWTFKPPFQAIVHRWDHLNTIAELTTDPTHREAVEQLMAFLRPMLAPSVDALLRTKETGKISFDDLWQIFPPGEVAITSFFGVEAACRVAKYERVAFPPHWAITANYVDWNGESCGVQTTTVKIEHYGGLCRVTSLPICPLSLYENAESIRTRIVERGRKFETLRGYHFQTCHGTKILLEAEKPERRPVRDKTSALHGMTDKSFLKGCGQGHSRCLCVLSKQQHSQARAPSAVFSG